MSEGHCLTLWMRPSPRIKLEHDDYTLCASRGIAFIDFTTRCIEGDYYDAMTRRVGNKLRDRVIVAKMDCWWCEKVEEEIDR